MMDATAEDLGKLDGRVRAKLEKAQGSAAGWSAAGPSLTWRKEEEELIRTWEKATRHLKEAWTAEEIRHLRKKWTPLVVSPVDKLGTDGILL